MRSKIIARNTLLTAADQVFFLVSSLVTIVLVARVLGPEKLGHYSYIMWVVGVATLVGLFGVPSATRKYVAEFLGKGDPATARAIIKLTFRLQLGTSLVVMALGILVAMFLVSPEHQSYTILALLSIMPAMLLSIPSSVNEAIEDFGSNILSSITAQVVNLLGVAVVLLADWGLVGLSAVLLLQRSVDFGVRYSLFRRRFPQYLEARFGTFPQPADSIPPDLKKRMIRFCWQATGLLAVNLVVWGRSEIFFLERFCDIQEVAFYSMSFGVVAALTQFPTAFGKAAGANLMAQQGLDPEPLPRLTAIVLRFQALLALPMALGMAVISSAFVIVFYGAKYEPAIPVLAILALFSVPAALMSAVQQLLIASEQQSFLLKWGIITGVLNLLLGWWWIPTGGAIAAALANGVSQSVAAAGIWIFAVRRYTIPLPWMGLLRVTASALAMAALVAAVTHFMTPVLASTIGVLIGALSFVLFLKWTRSLEPVDRERLIGFQGSLPPRLRNWYALGVQMVTS